MLRFLPGGIAPLGRRPARLGDLAMAAFVVGILAMMILPLPTAVLDLLVTGSVTAGVVILLVAVYIEESLRITSFPSIVLLSTLFRLAIEVSATRLILGQANAGEVIRAFGQFVVRGNIVVGAVVFLILTLVQFLVIARGAERVAEVGARFTLDAMPGKQMAIDAELRSGGIDLNEARRRRAAVQREAQLYGAMDGAMKFVKGDAIAGIAIIVINIVAGLLIGVLQRGMPIGDAVRVYTVLTIGDGLVSQIPALLVSTAAGLVVTRVASDEEGGHLGRDIGRQVLGQRRPLLIAGGVLLLFAAVPGLPHVPFLVLGGVIGGTAYVRLRRDREATEDAQAEERGASRAPGAPASIRGSAPAAAEGSSATVVPVLLELADDLAEDIAAGGESDRLIREQIPALRRQVYLELGVQVPGIRVHGGIPGLPAGGFILRIRELPMARGVAPRGRCLAVAEPERLKDLGVDGEPAALPDGLASSCWIPAGDAPRAHAAGVTTLSWGQALCQQLGVVLRRHATSFVGIQETQGLLDGLERTSPALVREVVPRLATPHLLTEVLRRLVEENVSIRNLRDILEALASWAPQEKDPVLLVEYVRAALKRQITLCYTGGGGPLAVHLLDREVEEAIRGAIHRTGAGSFLAIEPSVSAEILGAMRRTLAGRPCGAPPAVLLTSMELRRYVRKLVEIEHPEIAVLSYQELAPEVRVQPVGRIGLDGAA